MVGRIMISLSSIFGDLASFKDLYISARLTWDRPVIVDIVGQYNVYVLIILGMTVMLSLEKMNIRICRVRKRNCPPLGDEAHPPSKGKIYLAICWN